MLKNISLCIAICLACFAPLKSAYSDNFRVVTVDVNKLINDLPESKSRKAEIDREQQTLKTKIDNQRNSIKSLEAKFKAAGSNPQSKEAEALRTAIKSYEEAAVQARRDLQNKFLKINQELSNKVLTVIRRYAKSNNISLVLDKNQQGTSPLLYGDEAVDITNVIAKALHE